MKSLKSPGYGNDRDPNSGYLLEWPTLNQPSHCLSPPGYLSICLLVYFCGRMSHFISIFPFIENGFSNWVPLNSLNTAEGAGLYCNLSHCVLLILIADLPSGDRNGRGGVRG